jgi:hypothetical protein
MVMDKRRRRFVMHDVYFLDDALGSEIYARFGGDGIALWMGFIAACKKNHIQGEMSYTTDAEALAVLGVPGLAMTNNDGELFSLEEFWTLLGHHKVTRRRRSGRRLHVACTRWERWQKDPRRRDAGSQTGWSDDENADQMPPDSEPDTGLETDTDTDTETSLSSGDEKGFARQVWKTLAEHDAADFVAKGGQITGRGFYVTAAKTREIDHGPEVSSLRLLHPDWTVEQVVTHLLESEKPLNPVKLTIARPPCEICEDMGWIIPDGRKSVIPCECRRKAS